MLLLWSLVCRSVSASTIHLSHIFAREDCIAIVFSKSKTDQAGNKPQMKHHVFANPLNPSLCPILGLGLYLMEGFTDNTGAGYLFPGNNQEKHFGKVLSSLWQNPDVAAELQRAALVKSMFGTHSWRKGAASAAALGSPQGPGILALCLRAGWTIGSVLERYLKKQSGSDCFMGRILAGLPLDDVKFATLPPHFNPSDDVVHDLLPHLFGQYLCTFGNLEPVLRLCFASVVFHSDWLAENCPDHPVVKTYLFAQPGLLNKLKDRLVPIDAPSPFMKASGIPDSVSLKQDMLAQNDATNGRLDCLEASLGSVNDTLKELLSIAQRSEGRPVNASVPDTGAPSAPGASRAVTSEELATAVECIQRTLAGATGIVSGAAALQAQEDARLAEATRVAEHHRQEEARRQEEEEARALANSPLSLDHCFALNDKGWPVFDYHDCTGTHLLRRDYQIPTVLISIGWQLWFLGDRQLHVPPLRSIPTTDLRHSLCLQKTYSEWKKVYGGAELYLKMAGIDLSIAEPGDILTAYAKAQPFFTYKCNPRRKRPVNVLTLAAELKVKKLKARCMEVIAAEAQLAASAAAAATASQ
jgi:hypothetical protein